jgi:hypothetical protein
VRLPVREGFEMGGNTLGSVAEGVEDVGVNEDEEDGCEEDFEVPGSVPEGKKTEPLLVVYQFCSRAMLGS